MKCISLWQPWASLVAVGAKRIETRHWKTDYRGPLAIHASKNRSHEGFRGIPHDSYSAMLRVLRDEPEPLPYGYLIAVVRLIACVDTDHLKQVNLFTSKTRLDKTEELFGNYAPGRYGWILSGLHKLPEPIPFRAQQGIFDLPLEVEQQMSRQLILA